MKQLLLSAAIFLLIGCSKEKITEPPSGIWTIVETNTDAGGILQVQNYSPSSEITLQFGLQGKLILSGANPGVAMSPLWEYDKYEISDDKIIRFYQSAGSKETRAYFTLDGELYLNYFNLNCGYEEKFLKIK